MKTENFDEAKQIKDRLSLLERKAYRIKTLLTCNDLSARINGTPSYEKKLKDVPKWLRKEEDFVSDNKSYLLMLLENDLGNINAEIEDLTIKFNNL